MTTDRPPSAEDRSFDAIVVGARVAGSATAIRLARAGWRVALVDRATFPSDTLSTHVVFPDGLARLDDLGALERLAGRHDLAPAAYSWRVLGHEVAGTFTPVGGHDRCLSVRRLALDAVLVELAAEAGATMLLGHRMTDLLGSGSDDDPVRGVRLEDGTELTAPWVVGADGQRSTVARQLGVERVEERRGELAMLLGYWRGLPASDWIRIDMHADTGLMVAPCEDGVHLLTVAGTTDLTRGRPDDVEARYHRLLTQFPAVLNPRLLATAALVGPVVGAPETMLRGYFRAAAGPGWALVGDASHFKHPVTGQGIGDALAQAAHVADDLLAGGDLSGYQRWRDERSAAPFEFSYAAARLPGEREAATYAGLAEDPVAGQAFLDTFTRRTSLGEVFTRERQHRWRVAAAYEDGLRRAVALLEDLTDEQWRTMVPACPLWSVHDLVAHLVGVAEESARGRFFPEATDAWADPELAEQREVWTAEHVSSRLDVEPARLLADLHRHGSTWVRAVRRGDPAACDVPAWMLDAPVADLAAHLEDLHEAVGRDPEPDAAIARFGFASFRAWLGARVAARSLPPLRLAADGRDWVLGGDGEPGATLRATSHAAYRAISGRRPPAPLSWDGDPAPYLAVLSPYPPPE